jgi:hypothetical protein
MTRDTKTKAGGKKEEGNWILITHSSGGATCSYYRTYDSVVLLVHREEFSTVSRKPLIPLRNEDNGAKMLSKYDRYW